MDTASFGLSVNLKKHF